MERLPCCPTSRRMKVVTIYVISIMAVLLIKVYTFDDKGRNEKADQSIPIKAPVLQETHRRDDGRRTLHTYKGVRDGHLTTQTADVDTQQTMERRSSILRDACSKLQNASEMYAPFLEDNLVVDNGKQIIQCIIPKIAGTNFRRVFIGLSGMVNMSNISKISGTDIYRKYYDSLKLIRKNNKSAKTQKLHSYKKFIFVREPFERLVSAYRNKLVFHPNPNNRKQYYNQIISFYNRNPKLKNVRVFSRNVSQDGVAYTFQEFVQYVVDQFEIKSLMNAHFAPYWRMCLPCDIHYDYIGKYEALYEDTDYIFSKLSIDAKFPERNDNYTTSMTRDVVGEYYKQIPQTLRKQLWEYLKTDYQMFDYTVPEEMKFDNNSSR